MVIATCVQASGALQELNVPAKCADVLEWLRTKTKQAGLQFQGKIQDKDNWVTIFAESGEDDDENVNQHMLGGNFQDEIFVGSLVVMLSSNSNSDNYDKPSSAYMNLKPEITKRFIQVGRLKVNLRKKKMKKMKETKKE